MLAPFLFGRNRTGVLTLSTVDMAKNPKTKSPDSPGKKKKPARKGKSKYLPEMAESVEKVVLMTGNVTEAYKSLGVSKSTFYDWIKAHPDLETAISRAHEDRQRFVDRGFLPQKRRAIDGLDESLTGHMVIVKRTEKNNVYDRKTQKLIRQINVKEIEQEQWIKPDMKAIEKVLGPNALSNTIFVKALEDHMLSSDSDLYKLVFGDLSLDEKAEQFEGVFVLRLQLDQLKLRYMEAFIQREYDRRNIPIEQWIDFTLRIRKEYAQISDRMETRAQKMLGGYSYQEVILQVEQVWKTVVETFEEAVASTYDRAGKKKPYTVPGDVQTVIMEKAVQMIRSRGDKNLLVLKNAPLP